jgi:hypothetical protein
LKELFFNFSVIKLAQTIFLLPQWNGVTDFVHIAATCEVPHAIVAP